MEQPEHPSLSQFIGQANQSAITQFGNATTNNIHIAPPKLWKPPLMLPPRAQPFVGREEDLAWLLEQLTTETRATITLCGPGGMGKTALIAEVLWKLFPNETLPDAFPDGLIYHSFYRQPEATIALEQIARTFEEEPLPTPALAVQRVLSRKRMLLVFDGAEETEDLRLVLEVCAGQTILIASRKRSNATDLRFLHDLLPLPTEHAIAVVRAYASPQASDELVIHQICGLVGNLPLALRLSGRYLALHQEEAGEYLQWLRESPLAALDQGRSQHESVPILLERSITRISGNAQQALMVIGLLAPSSFDRVLMSQVLNLSISQARKALNELQDFGLLLYQRQRYEVSHALVHTYARQILLTEQDDTCQQDLARRIVQVLTVRVAEAKKTRQDVYTDLLPHIQMCQSFTDQDDLALSEMAWLFAQAGGYLFKRDQYEEAEPLLHRALIIRQRVLGPEHLDTALSLHNLAGLYDQQGKYTEAEPLLLRALAICEQQPEAEYLGTALSLHNLAGLYERQSKYAEAEQLYRRALAIDEQQLGAEHPDTANCLSNLAALYMGQGRYEEAEPLLLRALAIYRQVQRAEEPGMVSSTLNNLAALSKIKGQYMMAEQLYQEALAIYEQMQKPEHPDTVHILNSLATLYGSQGQYAEAESLLQRALAICERVLGAEHPNTALSLHNLAGLYISQGQYAKAESLLQQVLTIREQVLGLGHPTTVASVNNLATLYEQQGRYEEATSVYQRALAIAERILEPGHTNIKTLRVNYMLLLQQRHLES